MSNLICDVCKNNNDQEEVTRQKCSHIICWECLKSHVLRNLAPKIKCPIADCHQSLTDNAIRKVLSPDETIKYENLILKNMSHKIKCLLNECTHTFVCTNLDVQFDCQECSLFNCLACKAAHKSMSCKEFNDRRRPNSVCEEEMERARKELASRRRQRHRENFEHFDDLDIFLYDDLLKCPACDRNLAKGDGVLLRCSHKFCRFCLEQHINNSLPIPILCPTHSCKKPLEEREILKLIEENDRKIYIERCFSTVRSKLTFTFQCQMPNCPCFWEYSTKPDKIYCNMCKVNNCTTCYAIHTNLSCQEYKNQIASSSHGIDLQDIEMKIKNKQLMRCLKCHQILKKISGCSWIQCSNCKFEMCWALQIARWGPKGRGDISGGCKCKVNGEYCTPDCGSCIPHRS